MAEPFIGEIILVGFNYPPRGFAHCDGQLLPISQNQSLFSILGTTFGGDGRTTFALPDLRGRAPMHRGQGLGLSARLLGQRAGSERIPLTENEMPSHTHEHMAGGVEATNAVGDSGDPSGRFLARPFGPQRLYGDPTNLVSLASESTSSSGGGQAHNNMQPFLAINFCIALVGLYPPR